MPPYWYSKALPTTTLTHLILYFKLFDYFLFFIENKCLYDAIQDLKREKKS